jgi:YidC/Oxa1 family membrane protein insertase
MEKRLILAIALSLLILLSWSAFVSKTYHTDSKEVTTTKTEPVIAEPSVASLAPPPIHEQEFPESSQSKFTQDKFYITFIDPSASIKEIEFKARQNYKFPLISGFLLEDKSLNFNKENSSRDSITFVHNGPRYNIIKKFTFHNSNYSIELDVKIRNISKQPIIPNMPLILGILDFSTNSINTRYQDVAVSTKDKTLHLSAQKNREIPEIKFLALRDRYFCAIIEPEQNSFTGFIRKINSKESEVGLRLNELSLGPGQMIEQKFHIYLGPQELKLINSIKPEWSAVVYYGTFDFISQILLQLLEFLYRIVHNWGWAIVLLSLLVYFILYPLTLKQMRSMKEMQILQPKIEELRKAYKDNPQKLNKEIMELYREHKVNPLGGCLPLILQMPIFFALYQALMRSIALRGAQFLWIKDLSEPDRLFLLPTALPVLGNEINILPIVMAIGMFIQQKFTMATSATTTGAEQQKIMMIVMPIMFGVIFYHMPAGLVLYWFINSALMLVYQIRISKAK